MSDIQTREVTYQAGDSKMKGFLAWDGAVTGQRPGVLVVHEFWGLNDYARNRAEMLAELGYTALAVDLYGEGKVAADRDEAAELMNQLLADMPECRARFGAALDLLKAHETVDENCTAAIGYCMGGGIVLHMARYGLDLDVVASFHGSLPLAVAPAGEGAEVTARIVAYNGAADSFIPAEAITAFKAEMEKTGADYQFIQLPGALHGFSNPEATAKGEQFNMPLQYDALADTCSWAHMRLLLQWTFQQ
ncbi:MAG: dienelactone hydrolase family protein [Xanthomonadales bacterium]|nr:dienelactone hydrolase family protein [Xanthomonadales bacterium]